MYICIRIRISHHIYMHMLMYTVWCLTLNTLCVTQTLVNATHTQRRLKDTMNSLENRIAPATPNMVYHLFVNKIHTAWRSTWGPPSLEKPKSQMKFVMFLSYVSHAHDVAIEWLVQFPVWQTKHHRRTKTSSVTMGCRNNLISLPLRLLHHRLIECFRSCSPSTWGGLWPRLSLCYQFLYTEILYSPGSGRHWRPITFDRSERHTDIQIYRYIDALYTYVDSEIDRESHS